MTASDCRILASFLSTSEREDCASFLSSMGFADFDVGSVCVECYRSDVAINLMSGKHCRFGSKGATNRGCEITRVVNPDGSRTTEYEVQGEKHVGTIQKDQRANTHR